MTIWELYTYTDLILFILVSLTVLYLGIFALASMFSRHSDIPKARVQNRFIILIPAYKNGPGALQSVRSVLSQVYPQRSFDVTVIADHVDEMNMFRLAQQPYQHKEGLLLCIYKHGIFNSYCWYPYSCSCN